MVLNKTYLMLRLTSKNLILTMTKHLARYDTVRTLLAVAASKELHVKEFGVKSSFLNGKLEEAVYLEQQKGF